MDMWNGDLVFGDLGDGTHGALFEAFAAADAGVFVDDLGNAAGNFQNLLRTSVDADTATNALVSINDRTCHDELLFLISQISSPWNLSVRKIPLLPVFASA